MLPVAEQMALAVAQPLMLAVPEWMAFVVVQAVMLAAPVWVAQVLDRKAGRSRHRSP